MKKKFSNFLTILKRTFKGWNADDPFRQSSVIAYYAIFSLPALLVMVINISAFFFDKETVSGEVSSQIENTMGPETADNVGDIVDKASESKSGLLPTVIGLITLIFGATGVFIQLQKSLNQIWDVRQKATKGFVKMLKSRLFSFGLIVSIGFLLLVSLVLSSFMTAASDWMKERFPDAIAVLFFILEILLSWSIVSVLFALMFKILPDVHIRWRNVWIGSIMTGGLFMIGKYALSLYFGKADPASVYGAAGSIVLVLLWVSYSSMIVFFGAEFTKQYAVYHDIIIKPTKDAEKIPENSDPLNRSAKAEDAEKAAETEAPVDSKEKTR